MRLPRVGPPGVGGVAHVRVTPKYPGAADCLARRWWNGDDLVPEGTSDVSLQRLEELLHGEDDGMGPQT